MVEAGKLPEIAPVPASSIRPAGRLPEVRLKLGALMFTAVAGPVETGWPISRRRFAGAVAAGRPARTSMVTELAACLPQASTAAIESGP